MIKTNEIKNTPIITKLSKVDKDKKNPYTKITFLIIQNISML